MVRRWDHFRDPWDREYAMRGRLWRGGVRMEGLEDFLPAQGRILELGCGDGKLLRELGRRGHDVIGLDRSVNALRLAAEGDARLVQGDVRSLPVRSGAFTLVIARYVLGALREADRRAAARAAWDVVAPGGRLWFEEFATHDFRASDGDIVEPGTVMRNRGILAHYWTRAEVVTLLDDPPHRVIERRWAQRTGQGHAERHAIQAGWLKPRR